MTNEQRETIDRLERYLIADKINLYTTVRTDDLDTVLSLLKENSAEIQQKNTELAEKSAELDKKDKQIDLMAEMIDKLSEYYTRYHGKNNEFCKEICIEKDIDCINCIKQYFVDLVEKE